MRCSTGAWSCSAIGAGGIHWWSEAGFGDLDPTSRAPALGPIVAASGRCSACPASGAWSTTGCSRPRPQPSIPRSSGSCSVSPRRTGAQLLALADGTVLVVGGRRSDALTTLAAPTLLRLRPELDGPDEWIPDLAGPQTDAFVGNVPGRATVVVGGLQIDADGSSDPIASVHAHVRGFRSRGFRLEFEWESDPDTVAQVMLGHGAVSVVSVALLADEVVVRQRQPSGAVETLDCALAGVEVGAGVVVELDELGERLRVSTNSGPVAECSLAWAQGETPAVSVGFGAAGSGSLRLFGLRLARR